MRTTIFAASAAAVAIVAFAGHPAAAQTFGEGQDITVMQGFQPGGGSDALAQLVQPFLAEELGVNFVNQYIPGATGAIAWTQLARQVTPDDNAISITNTPMLMTNYIMNEAITYSIEEITPLANVVTDPGVMVVAADSPFQTFEDLLEAARSNPGTITVGNSGVGGDDFFSSVMIERETGVQFQKIPFQGDGPSWQAALGGQIDASDNNLGITFPQIQAGNLRVLAVFSEERIEQIPDVPTLRELGYDVVAGSSRGYSGPADMSEEAIATFDAAMQRVIENPAFREAAAARAFNIDYMDSTTYAAFLREQEQIFQGIWEDIKDDVDMN